MDIYKIKRWQTTKTLPQLGPDATHIWQIDLDLASNDIKYLLSDSELERSERFISDRDRNRFIQGRGGMRSILGNYLGMPGQQLQIDIAKHGKPFLTHPGTNLQFNLTHTAGMALLAVTLDTAIGIDMEQIRDHTGYMRIAKRIFADSIYNHLVSLPESDRYFAFLCHWTEYESQAKLHGGGVFSPIGPDQPSVSRHFSPADGWLACIAGTESVTDVAKWKAFRFNPD